MEKSYILYKGVWVGSSIFEDKLSEHQCDKLLSEGGFLVRNVFDFDRDTPSSFWYVIKDSFGGMEELSAKMRNQIRRSFKTCDIRMVSKEEMLSDGYMIYCAATQSYKVKAETPTLEAYNERINKSGGDIEFWAAFDKTSGKMIAFAINQIFDNYCNYQTMKAIPSFLKSHYPYYGLIYEMNRHYLENRKLKFVSDGARSITNHSNIQPFLIDKFKFRKAYCNIRLTYKWWFGLAVKVLYPFRRIIPSRKVVSILNMEAMQRGEL